MNEAFFGDPGEGQLKNPSKISPDLQGAKLPTPSYEKFTVNSIPELVDVNRV